MAPPVSRWIRDLIVCLAVALLTGTAVTGAVPALARNNHGDRIVMLGAGNTLSVLVTSGSTRLLLATGSSRTDFANAFEAAMPFGIRRIDVVLVAGYGTNLVVPSRALDQLDPPFAAAVHPLAAGDAARHFPAGPPAPLDGSTRIRLGDRVSLTLETATTTGSENARLNWRALIQRGRTTVAVLSSAEAYDDFAWSVPLSALIVVDGSIDSVDELAAAAVAGPAIGMDADRLRAMSANSTVRYAIEVRPAAAIEMRFVEGGLRLPSSAQRIELSASG